VVLCGSESAVPGVSRRKKPSAEWPEPLWTSACHRETVSSLLGHLKGAFGKACWLSFYPLGLSGNEITSQIGFRCIAGDGHSWRSELDRRGVVWSGHQVPAEIALLSSSMAGAITVGGTS